MAFPLPDTNFKIYPPITIPFCCSPGQDHRTHSIIGALLFYFPMQVTLLTCSRGWQTTNRISTSPLHVSLNAKHYTSSLPQELDLLIIRYATLPCPHSLFFPASFHTPASFFTFSVHLHHLPSYQTALSYKASLALMLRTRNPVLHSRGWPTTGVRAVLEFLELSQSAGPGPY